MKITATITIASSVLLAAGCAHETREARSNQSIYSPSYSAVGGTSDSAHAGSQYRTYSDNTSSSMSASQASATSQDPLVSQIRSSLATHSELATIAPNIQISVNNGAVTLNGNVQSEDQKQNIESLVQQISGVTTVNNQLQVSTQAAVGGSVENKDNASSWSGGAQSQDRNAQSSEQNQSLNPTSRTNENSAIYSDSDNSLNSTNSLQGSQQNGSLSPTSRSSDTSSSLYSGGSSNQMGEANIKSEGGDQSQAFTPTSRTNENSSIYHSSSTNSVGGSQNDILSPTSRTNSEEQIYSRTNDTSSATENSLSPTSDRSSEATSSQSGRDYGVGAKGASTGTSQSSQYSTGQSGAMNIQVQGETSTDQTLGQQIRQQLSGNSSLTSLTSPIQIRVNNGVVTLQGSVRTQEQKQQVETAIQGITGVSRVDNRLTVSTDQTNR